MSYRPLVKEIAEHKDLIHDVSFDFHGKRMATCSSDQTVKIFDRDDIANGEWKFKHSWKAHTASVWRVSWANPEFGSVIATCSFDRTVQIWEEVANDHDPGKTTWTKRSNLADNRENVTDVKFAPPHLGLALATCSQDGLVRIYEAPDIMNLTNWNHAHEIPAKFRCSCLAWNHSRFHRAMFAVGCDDAQRNCPTFQIYEYDEQRKEYAKLESVTSSFQSPVFDLAFAPSLGRTFHMLAIGSTSLHVYNLTVPEESLNESAIMKKLDEGQVWRVSWDVMGSVLAAGSADRTVHLYKRKFNGEWEKIQSPFVQGTNALGSRAPINYPLNSWM